MEYVTMCRINLLIEKYEILKGSKPSFLLMDAITYMNFLHEIKVLSDSEVVPPLKIWKDMHLVVLQANQYVVPVLDVVGTPELQL